MTAAESPMGLSLEELTHHNVAAVRGIDRSDVSEAFVDTVDTILQTTDFGAPIIVLGIPLPYGKGKTISG